MAASTPFDRRVLVSVSTPLGEFCGRSHSAAVSFLRPMAGKLNRNAVSSGTAGWLGEFARTGWLRHPILERVQRVARHPPANPHRLLNKNG
jgi:hypothetical protein